MRPRIISLVLFVGWFVGLLAGLSVHRSVFVDRFVRFGYASLTFVYFAGRCSGRDKDIRTKADGWTESVETSGRTQTDRRL